jgi:hypothetical protein
MRLKNDVKDSLETIKEKRERRKRAQKGWRKKNR